MVCILKRNRTNRIVKPVKETKFKIMIKTFLEYVADDIIKKYGTNLSRIAVVFPNKRAALFMNEHLARIAGKPIWSPSYITISDLFRKHSDVIVGDSIKLICDLHKSFVECTGLNETLDHFYGWGQLLLTDYDDIDKNMADADKIFSNIKDIHELDDLSYLSDEQKNMLKRFFANFTDNQESVLKQRFLSLWNHFGDIYHNYKNRLRQQNIGYEGAVYRDVVTHGTIDFKYDKYLFVGFNLLQRVEQALFMNLKKQGKAHFYWDFDRYYMQKNKNGIVSEAGHYISMYLEKFPNELDSMDSGIYDNMRTPKEITFMSAPTENAQARYASQWLRQNNRCRDGRHTAVVMCDENILLPIMHSIPPEADKVNITSGFPLGTTPVASLVTILFDLYTTGIRKCGQYYKAQIAKKALTHPYIHYLSAKCLDVYSQIKEQHIIFPDNNVLTLGTTDDGLRLLFPDNFNDAGKASDKCHTALLSQICVIIKQIGICTKNMKDDLMQESLFRMFTIINRLESLSANGDLMVDITTLRRLTKQLITATSIPFHGEPIVGIQVMGVLETRNLDFDHLLLLSCNEGNMPKGVNDSSFIPYSIRKAYGLTTIDNKVAIYSYYFHRLLQRAKDITIAYNNTTDNGHTGEMSRFMLQLMVDGTHDIKHRNLVAHNMPTQLSPRQVDKDKHVMDILNNMRNISPSAINKYLRCPLKFFYQYVANIKEPDSEDDTVDNRMFGNIFHKAAQLVYNDIKSRGGVVEKSYIQKFLGKNGILEAIVDTAFNEELFKSKKPTVKAYYNGLQIINREVIIEYLRQLLKIDQQLAPFSIIALEDSAYENITFTTDNNDTERTIRIGGYIDRIDIVNNKESGQKTIRVVDYKTGHQATSKIKEIDEVFTSANISQKHSDYYLQTILYSLAVSSSRSLNPKGLHVSPALLFIKQTVNDGYDPVLEIGTQKISDVEIYRKQFVEGLKKVLSDIFNHQQPFLPTNDRTHCATCYYRMICGL